MITKLVLGAVAIYAAFCLGMYLSQEQFLFHPGAERATPADVGLTHFERVSFETDDDVALVGWFHENPKREKAIVFFYGNADALPPYAEFFDGFARAGYSVLGVNYRGYGGSGGVPSETGFYKDGDAALRFMNRYVPTEMMTLMGRSIGTGVAVDLAARNPVRALVLISPFTSVVDIASQVFWHLPVRYLLKHRFPSIDTIKGVHAPVLIVHGSADTLIPVANARTLYEAANEPKRLEIFEGGDHIDMDLDRTAKLVLEIEEKRAAAPP